MEHFNVFFYFPISSAENNTYNQDI